MRRALAHDRTNALRPRRSRRSRSARPPPGVLATLASYATIPHAWLWSAKLVGCSWYDDSKATNPDATLRALASFDSVVLLAGGRNKGLDLVGARARELAASAASSRSARPRPRSRPRSPASAPVVAVGLDARRGARRGRAWPGPATSVLLSPACASFDAYPATPRAATTSPPRSADCSSKERPADDRPHPAHPRPAVRSPVARRPGRRRGRQPPPRAAPAARLRRALRDGHGAQRRRPRDDPLRVVGRGAHRLRLVVVLLQPPAPVGDRRARARSSLASRSTTTCGAASRPWLLGVSLVGMFVVLVPGVGILVDGSRRWLGVGPLTRAAERDREARAARAAAPSCSPGAPTASTTGARGARCS